MKNILVLINAKSPFYNYWTQYANWVKAGFNPIFVSVYHTESKNYLTLHVAGKLRILSYVKLGLLLPKLVRHFRIDAIHAHYLSHHGLMSAIRLKIPIFISLYGTDINYRNNIEGYLLHPLLKDVKLFHAQSSRSLRIMNQIFRMSPSKLYLKHLGIAPDYINHPINEDTKEDTILSARTIHPRYNTTIILRLFAKIKQRYSNAKLILLRGFTDKSSNYYQTCLSLIDALGIAESVEIITEIVDVETMMGFYDKASFNINLPVQDQLSLTILEGMARGAIPILSQLEVYQETLSEPENAIYVDLDHLDNSAEKIVDFMKSKEEQRRIIERNRSLVEHIGSLDSNLTDILLKFKEML